jgi:hypothetical protein
MESRCKNGKIIIVILILVLESKMDIVGGGFNWRKGGYREGDDKVSYLWKCHLKVNRRNRDNTPSP